MKSYKTMTNKEFTAFVFNHFKNKETFTEDDSLMLTELIRRMKWNTGIANKDGIYFKK